MAIEIATFCVLPPEGNASRHIPGDLDDQQQLNFLFRSALWIAADTRFTVLTDPSTDLSSVQYPFLRWEAQVDPKSIMYERTRMQRDYLEQYSFDRPLVFLDNDILINGSLDAVFEQDFDIGLTWRETMEMPFNGGAIYVNNRNPQKVREFFRRFVEVYQLKYDATMDWYGDQFAMLNIVNLPFQAIPTTAMVERDGVKIALLPCDEYNFSPEEDRPNLFDFNPRAIVYHFKGMSRRLMEPFWDIHINSSREGIGRILKILYLNSRIRLKRRAYRRKFRKDAKRFDARQQNDAAGVDRTEIAVGFVHHAISDGTDQGRLVVADVGSGMGILKKMLKEQGVSAIYRGYDISPSASDAVSFDVERDRLPEDTDIAIALGVLEYCKSISVPLQLLHERCRYLIVSHPVRDLKKVSFFRRRKLRWRSHLTKAAFVSELTGAGFEIIEEKTTLNNRSIVWCCRKVDLQ